MLRAALLISILLTSAGSAFAQQGDVPPGAHREQFTPEAGPYFPLRPFLIPGSLIIESNGVPLDSSLYRLDARNARIHIQPAVLDTTLDLIMTYRTVPLRAGPVFTFIDTSRAEIDGDESPSASPARAAAAVDPFAGVSLQRRGSVTRGITTGSNRDVGVESGLRLELSGDVAENVRIRAMLSDENTPILPEGTTRRIEEFDRVFIEIESPVGTARLGDIDYSLGSTAFASFTRKLQGAAVSSHVRPGSTILTSATVNAAGATSRGQFRSQTIPLDDGVQGPYRLSGAQGEPFVLVIPGTERVYWDGLLLERGENRDYVIDYATGELSFTTNRIVSAERRVLVEFEYSTNQFTRTLLAAQAEAHLWRVGDAPRIRIGGAFIREADGSRFLDEFGLTSEDSLRLAQAGDQPAYRSGADQVVYDPEAPYVQYVMRDTLLSDGSLESYFRVVEQRPEQGQAVYRVRFAHVGSGNGRYERAGHSVNGIAYRYRGPRGGSYDPVRLLPAPVEKQVMDVYGSVAILPRLEVFGEWAQSLHDRNRLSSLDAADDQGSALELGMRLQPVTIRESIQATGFVRRRQVDDTFSPFDRIRPIEFGRHWNLSRNPTEADIPLGGRETIDEGRAHVAAHGIGEISGEVGRLRIGEWFQGFRREMALQSSASGWPHVDYRVEHIWSKDESVMEEGRWYRHVGMLQLPLLASRLIPGVQVELEDRRQADMVTDSLARSSFRFAQFTPILTWSHDELSATAEVTLRRDDEWIDGRLAHAFDSWIVSSGAEYAGRSFSGDLRVGYRERRFSDLFQEREGRADQTSLLIRTGARWRPHPRAVEIATSYEATSERTPLLQEIFVRTGPELGQYVWEDLNGDGVVQVDELIPERTPNEGIYARTYIPGDSLISSVTVRARAEVRLDGSSFGDSRNAWRRALGQISTRSVFEVSETTRDDDLARIYLLYLTRYRNPLTTINGRMRFGQNLTMFPRSRRLTIDVGHNQVRSLSTRTAGGEGRFFATWSADGRWALWDPLTLRLSLSRERNRQESEQFVTRRFDITGYRIDAEPSVRLGDALRILTPLALAWKDDEAGSRSARVIRVPVELQYQRAARLVWTSRFETARVDVDGESRGLAEYELTDGRGPGTSFLWSTSARYSINEYLRATLQYDGRAPEGAPVVHALRMQLSAVF